MLENGTLMQYFECNLPADGKLWKQLAADAPKLAQSGITGVWLPPAVKGVEGASDSGYNVYDLYDLGEFRQKGSIRTKYGTKKDYMDALTALKDKGINIYSDAYLNERFGADEIETVKGSDFNQCSSYQMVGDNKVIGAPTGFTFPVRKGKYSTFTWNWKHFGRIEWNSDGGDKYDYMMSSEVDLSNKEVLEEYIRWAVWYVQTADIDGLCLERSEKIPAEFSREFLNQVRVLTGKEFFTISSLWNGDVNKLLEYMAEVRSETSLLDVPLHHNSACHEDYPTVRPSSYQKKVPQSHRKTVLLFFPNQKPRDMRILSDFL